MSSVKDKKSEPLSEETIESLTRLGGILAKIVHRLVREGKAKVVNGKIIFNDDHNRRTTEDPSRKV